jgi:NADH-quinone oxidoreductase subunit A
MDRDLESFVPVFIYLGVLVVFLVVSLGLAHWIAPRRKTPVKEMPYESGMDPIGDARQHFDIKYYLVAILFLVFDLELLFLYPWAVTAYQSTEPGVVRGLPFELRGPVFVVMLVFIGTLVIAYLYAWRKGVFKWR